MGCSASKKTLDVMDVEVPNNVHPSTTTRPSKRPSTEAIGIPAKSARASVAEKAAAAAAAAAAAEQASAATTIAACARGKLGRKIAANTVPPCAAACPCYAIDMNAEVFGSCIRCGFPKAGHTEKALKGGSKAALKKRGSAELRAKMVQREKADCKEFRVNMDPSLPFGTCLCGRPRAEHTEAALAVRGGMGTTRADSGELRCKMVQREKADCKEFRVNMDPSVPFGTCLCGRPRAEHTEAALAVRGGMGTTRADSGELRCKMVQREKAACAAFRLNMDPSVPFGTCRCGRPRAEHTEAALAADSDKNSGKRLHKRTSADVRREMEAKQDEIGTAVEAQGAKTGVAFGLANTVRTAADEQAAIEKAINARAGGADKAAALNDFNEMMKETTGAPAA